MHICRPIIQLFLVYLVLLWNLGPSLHHADWLGFHVHPGAGCAQTADSHSHVSTCGCCCHSHSLPDKESGETGSIGADHVCGFCQFFKQFNVVFCAVDEPMANTPALMRDVFFVEFVTADSIRLVARGPPAA